MSPLMGRTRKMNDLTAEGPKEETRYTTGNTGMPLTSEANEEQPTTRTTTTCRRTITRRHHAPSLEPNAATGETGRSSGTQPPKNPTRLYQRPPVEIKGTDPRLAKSQIRTVTEALRTTRKSQILFNLFCLLMYSS
ncbi:unnamed protein product [Brassica rapa subsp. narinosa]|uniref:(rape) hypothetical protein n=1 Tax=Brassica napus TaxID=3708 RepID=A0A817BFE4_BRANA|nr:unnamed protein product [Brassica napus]